MYRKVDSPPTPAEKFELPFEGKLSQDNRWVIMANLIPWDEFEEEYAQNFAEEIGAPALPFRIALGSLIIKERLGISERETVEQIKENPYLQYFIGRKYYSTEKIIDTLYEPLKGKLEKKPKTYRNLARKNYLQVAKKRRPSRKERRKAIRKQLQYVKRNLAHIDQLTQAGVGLEALSSTQYKSLLVVAEVYRQQQWMYDNKTQRIEDRIVSLSQPHIRPIVRGKAGTSVEFGAKLSVSLRDGYVFLDRIDWNNFNESGDLKAQVEAFKQYTGRYPESVHVDRIYRTRENRAWCKEKGIRISGPPLGRPPANVSPEKKKQALEDERIRNAIEGKFGVSKRRFSLNRVMAKLPHTSQTAIAITFLVINLSALLQQVFCLFLCFKQNNTFFGVQLLIQVMIEENFNNKSS